MIYSNAIRQTAEAEYKSGQKQEKIDRRKIRQILQKLSGD